MERQSPPFLNLPVEVICCVAGLLKTNDLSALSRSCRDLHFIVVPRLYARHKDDTLLMSWAIETGRTHIVDRLIAAGANVNVVWHSALEITDEQTERYEMLYGNLPHPADLVPMEYPYDLENRDADRYWAPLHSAVIQGHDQIVGMLLDNGADINAPSRDVCICSLPKEDDRQWPPDPSIWTPLHLAICHRHESIVRLLLSRGASIGVSPMEGLIESPGSGVRQITALHSASYIDDPSILRLLIDEGYQTDVNVEDPDGRTPISYAYFAGNWDAIRFLKKAGASVNACLGRFTLLKHACYYNRYNEAYALIGLGADISLSLVKPEGLPSLIHCCLRQVYEPRNIFGATLGDQEWYRARLIMYFHRFGAQIEGDNEVVWATRTETLQTPLLTASRLCLYRAVKALISRGANVYAVDDQGHAPLMVACSANLASLGERLRTVKELLAAKPRGQTLETLWMLCGSRRSRYFDVEGAELARLLIDPKYQPDPSSPEENYRLMTRALVNGNCRIAKVLSENGRGASLGHEDIADVIRTRMADDDEKSLEYISTLPEASGVLGDSSLVLNAIERCQFGCAAFLIAAGAPADYQSCLAEACRVESTAVAKMLLEKGADPNGCRGREPLLTRAVLNRDVDMVRLLLDYGATMHRHPQGSETDGPFYGPLDLAISLGMEPVVQAMCSHQSYLDSTEAQRIAHLETACWAEEDAVGDGSILGIILRSVSPDVVLPEANTTALHLCAARGISKALPPLVLAGANIHQCIEPSVFLPPQESVTPPSVELTLLEWAILNAHHSVVEGMLDITLGPKLKENRELPLQRYAQAAFRRRDSFIIYALFESGLDLNIRDEFGGRLVETLQ